MTTTSTDSAASVAQRRADERGDRVSLMRATGIVAIGYGIGAAIQSTYVYATYIPAWQTIPLWARLTANVTAVVVLVGVLALMRAHLATRLWQMAACVLVASTVAAVARFVVQATVGVHAGLSDPARSAEILSGFVLGAISGSIGMWSLNVRRRNRARTRAATRDAVHVELAVKALEQEEIRVRLAVAEGLHGTLQSKLVLVDARLGDVLAHAGVNGLDQADVASLRWVRAELDEAREIDVRQMSRLLYPDRLELGLAPAVRALLGRLPASIATRLIVSDEVRRLDDPAGCTLTVSERLLATRVVEEGITNALKHGPASSVVVKLDAVDHVLCVAVENDGVLFDPAVAGASSGTSRLATRLSLVGGRLELSPGAETGARLQAWIPLGADNP